jgi:hypothetical protein
MNPIRHIRRVVGILAGLTAALVAFGVTPAFARVPVPLPLGGGNPQPASAQAPVPVVLPAPVRTIVAGGMPGWQIALIAVGAALLAAAAAVLAYRALAGRRRTAATAA